MLSVLKAATIVSAAHNISTIYNKNCHRNYKVCVIGAAGGIGQPLSLLLKMNPMVSHLALYDLAPLTPGVAVDISHMDRAGNVTGHRGPEQLCQALMYSNLVICPAGLPRKPGMSRDDLFKTNASIIRDLACAMVRYAPCAILAIITNPVNSMVPIAAEVMMAMGIFDPRRVMGVTTLDVVRSKRFIAEINCVDPGSINIPVIGGHSGVTIIPVLSQSSSRVNLPELEIKKLTKRIQEAGTEVVKAKAGGGSATLSMAYAGAHFANSVLRGLAGEPNVVECVYVNSCVSEAAYFANPCVFGRCGIEMNLGYGCLNSYERELLQKAMPELIKNIQAGQAFVRKPNTK